MFRFWQPNKIFMALLLLFSACANINPPEKAELTPVTFHDLPGWESDTQSAAVPALLRSCSAMIKKEPAWQPLCAILHHADLRDDVTARDFFERWFQPYAVNNGAMGLFTGYYEAELHGAWKRGGKYQTPLWAQPDDLVMVDLGEFSAELKGKRIAGKVVKHKLKPYETRAKIAAGALKKRAKVLLWVDDPVTAFFLEIQGSGRVRMTDGSVVQVGFAAQNGHEYVPIGRVMADDGLLERPVTMQKIRAWLAANPKRAQEMMNHNPSVVFFYRLKGEGPMGSQGVVLTPERSLAVDTRYMKLGTPVWLDMQGETTPSQRLVIAQDTGGAIKGAVRGDLFWGAGVEAEAQAGKMQSRGSYYVLLLKTVAP